MLDIFNSETDFPSISRTSPDKNLRGAASDLWQEYFLQVQGMRNPIFPPFSPSFCSSGNEEDQMAISNVPTNFQERTNSYGSGFFLDSQISNHLHLGSVCPLPTVNTSEGLVFLPAEGDHGLKTSSLYENRTVHSRLVPRVSANDERAKPMEDPRNRTNSANKETTTTGTACKKRKAAVSVDHEQQRRQPEESSSSPIITPMKAPLRRNHKLGDRVTALQQLVSPFGKTDTASVLQEATIYIKLLQEQIQVLSNPYFRFRPSHSSRGTSGGGEEDRHDLHSRGLCLVPVSSTLNLAKEAGSINQCPSFMRNVISRF